MNEQDVVLVSVFVFWLLCFAFVQTVVFPEACANKEKQMEWYSIFASPYEKAVLFEADCVPGKMPLWNAAWRFISAPGLVMWWAGVHWASWVGHELFAPRF